MIPRQIPDLFPPLIRPTLTNCGFAVFSAANATIVMGGAFPFLPANYQGTDNMFAFYLAQSVMLAFTLLVGASASMMSGPIARTFPKIATGSYFVGSCLAISIAYTRGNNLALFVSSGVLLGVGTAGIHLAWQRILAAQPSDEGGRNLIVGTALSAIVYFALYLVPIAVTQLLIPTLFLPFSILCIVLEERKADFNQPMFDDRPSENLKVYRKAAKDYWHSAICIGSIGLASGVVRSMSITDAVIGAEINAAALAGSFVAAASLLIIWGKGSIRIGLVTLYRFIFPLLILGFVCLPQFGEPYARAFSVFLYMAYSFASMLVFAQCAQASRDRGINPIIMYGGFSGTVYLMHDIGFISGYSTKPIQAAGQNPYWPMALTTVALLALIYYLGYGGLANTLSKLQSKTNRVELITPLTRNRNQPRPISPLPAAAKDSSSPSLSKQCQLVQKHYQLTDRETEVMEHLAQGRSMRSVAEELVVSENTIRTHAKHIYAKLDVHKRKELQELIEMFGRE